MKKRVIFICLIVIISSIFILFVIRLINQKELDDVSPGIPCDKKLLEKADTLWIIPKFNNISISENQSWCEYILSLNKTLELHGVNHEYEEFATDKSQLYLEEGIKIFTKCFGKQPQMFKPPQLKISNNNKNLVKNNNLLLKGKINQILHKVYHCNDSDKIPNWVINLF